MRLSNLQISFHKQFLTLKTNSMITSLYPNLLKLQSFNPEILTAISTRPNLLSMAAWVGTSGVVAMFLNMLSYPWLEKLLWWMLGFSAVLVHMALDAREYVEGGENAKNDNIELNA